MSHDPDDPKLLMGVDDRADSDASVAESGTGPNPDEALSAQLAAALADLPDAIEPDRDLWSAIDADIAPSTAASSPAAPTGRRWVLLAAAAAVAATLGALAVGLPDREPQHEPVAEAPEVDDTATRRVRASEALATDLRRANAALVAQVDARDDLSPEARATIEENLERIDAAIAEVHTLLVDSPDDPELQRWLTDTEALKQRVLVSALHLPEGS